MLKLLQLLLQSLFELFQKLLGFFINRPAYSQLKKSGSFSLGIPCDAEFAKAGYRADEVSSETSSGFYLLESNLDAFLARYELIENAKQTLDLQYYYFHGDTSGQLIASALIKAANRQVRVRVLLDDIETLGADEAVRILNEHPGIEIRLFNPFFFRGLLRYIEFITDLSRVGRRMHNKAIIADNCQAIIGGRNIGDNYFSANPEFFFLDIDLLSAGPVVNEISTGFDEYWNSHWAVPVENLYSRPDKKYASKKIKKYLQRYVQNVKKVDFEEALNRSDLKKSHSLAELPYIWAEARLFYDAPSKIDKTHLSDNKQLRIDFHEIIHSAEHSLIFITPYFVPGIQGLNWFLELRAKGIEISVFTNSLAATDVVAVHAGYARYRKKLLAAGVNLYELKPSAYVRDRQKLKVLRPGSRTSLHAKTVIIDSQKVFIGSPNLDPRSSNLNTEMGLLVDNKALAMQVLDLFCGAIMKHNSYHLTLGSIEYKDRAPDAVRREKIVWHSEEGAEDVQYLSDPLAGFWRKLSVFIYRLLPVEELL